MRCGNNTKKIITKYINANQWDCRKMLNAGSGNPTSSLVVSGLKLSYPLFDFPFANDSTGRMRKHLVRS